MALVTILAQAAVVARTLVIDHVNVVDIERGAILRDQRVEISGARITAVGPSQGRVTADAIIFGNGRYMIPGLWDMHVHIDRQALGVLLEHGITGARDMGGRFATPKAWRDSIARGLLAGPRLILPGPMLVGPPATASPGRRVVTTPALAERAVDSLRRLGVDFIKVHEGVPRDAFFAIAAVIAPGKIADAVLLDGNPLEDVANLRRVSVVMFNGATVSGSERRSSPATSRPAPATR